MRKFASFFLPEDNSPSGPRSCQERGVDKGYGDSGGNA